MQVYKIVFSPTGGTEKVANILCGELGTDIETIDLSQQAFAGSSLQENSMAVIAMPSFGGRAPKTAIDRLKMVKANGSRAIVVAVYGNREQEDTLIEMQDTAVAAGFQVVAGIAAIAEHSIAHQYATGRPDSADEKVLKAFARKIQEKAANAAKPEIPGNRPYKKAGAGMVPKGSSQCTSCGLCAKRCPVGAIDPSNPRKTDKTVCINCMRCVAECPSGARAGNPLMTKVVGMALKKACSQRKENQLYI